MKTLQQEIRTIALWSAAGTLVFASGLWVFGNWHDEWSGYNAINAVSDGSCNIAVIPIVGDIIPYRGANEDGSGATPPPSTNPDDVLAALGCRLLRRLLRMKSKGYRYQLLRLFVRRGPLVRILRQQEQTQSLPQHSLMSAVSA